MLTHVIVLRTKYIARKRQHLRLVSWHCPTVGGIRLVVNEINHFAAYTPETKCCAYMESC
jgi:hypothetical protein